MTTQSSEPFVRIKIDKAKELMAQGDVEVIDVRELWEWNEGHIQGAKHIPVNDVLSRISEVPEDKPVIFYCAAGVRSALACEYAAAMGRKNTLYNMEGGMDAWKTAKLPFET